jgi:predicted nuclease of predicted toxin-antitoxin system
MKLVLGMNLPPSWAGLLGSSGFDAVHWIDIGPPNAPDQHIMRWAARHRRVLLTQDLDFGAILAATQAQRPSVVQLRGDDLINVQMVRRVAVALNQVADDLEAGALVTVDLFRTRIRVLPIHR